MGLLDSNIPGRIRIRTMPNVLASSQIDEFIETGVTILRDAFPAEVAARCRERVWQASGLRPDQPTTWTKPVVHLQEAYCDGPFPEVLTPAISGAMDDLLGAGRYRQLTSYGWWPISFPGFEKPPWRAPVAGWHVDGQHFHHRLDSSNQGLLPLFIFSQIQPGDGGTSYLEGSHVTTAKVLQSAEPAGLDAITVSTQAAAAADKSRALEGIGNPGDVLFLHPFMVHARSPNTGPRVRFICNPCIALHERIRIEPGGERTPLERSIIRAIGR
jgi:hypothetical protein